MTGKFVLSVVVMFVLSMLIGYLVHELALAQDYAQVQNLFRPRDQAAAYLPHMLIAHLLIAIAFVWIYLKGREDRPFFAQGVRYGIAIAVLMTIPIYLIYYAVQPMPGMLVAKQIVLDTIGVIAMGVVLAWLNR